MSLPTMSALGQASAWIRFWHAPLRAERLGAMRILLALAILADQLVQNLPHFADFYGPEGVGYAGLHDEYQLSNWSWTILVFGSDDLTIVYLLFFVWMTCTVVWLIGWKTRIANVLVWFLTIAFINRNPNIKNFGDSLLSVSLFLMMLSPSGRALSVDAWLRRRKLARLVQAEAVLQPATTPAWPVRLIQIQLCMIYLSTGLAKLSANPLFGHEWGTWWKGTSIWYVMNDCTRVRRAFAEYPAPFWITLVATYASVWFETLFPLLVLCRWTRRWTLWVGVLFHIGIWLTIEVGWFSFYTLCMYAVWIPDSFWSTWDPPREAYAPKAQG